MRRLFCVRSEDETIAATWPSTWWRWRRLLILCNPSKGQNYGYPIYICLEYWEAPTSFVAFEVPVEEWAKSSLQSRRFVKRLAAGAISRSCRSLQVPTMHGLQHVLDVLAGVFVCSCLLPAFYPSFCDQKGICICDVSRCAFGLVFGFALAYSSRPALR